MGRIAVRLTLATWLCLSAVASPPKKPVRAPAQGSAVRRWMSSLTLREKVAQLLFVAFAGAPANAGSREYRQITKLVREMRVGGLVLVNVRDNRLVPRAEPYGLATFLNRLQKMAKIPLLVAGDFERGASMRVDATTIFPHAMAFAAAADPSLTRYQGEVTAREARALGVHWVFYPVADVNNNPDNPIINIRSFGENPEVVARHVTAFIEGAHAVQGAPVLVTAKHFPGHGDTAVDSHLNLASIPADRERLNLVELAPFRAAIAAGVDSIMTAHLAVPALAEPDVPATLSPAILTGLLREQLGFRGLVVTDALEMGGIAKGFSAGDAAVRALEAGADLLLMPSDPEAALKGVMAALASGRLKRKRIEDSLARVLHAKQRLGLDRRRVVDPEAIVDVVNSPEANARAQEVADRSITLAKNEGQLVPLRTPAQTCFLVLTEGRYATAGQALTQELRRRSGGAEVLVFDPTTPWLLMEEAVRKTAACESIVAAAFATVAAFRGSLALPGEYPKLLEALIATGKPVALMAMGNPYLVRHFPKVSAYIAAYSTVPPSEIAAVKALFGEIPIRGRLPVTIPGVAECGTGIISGGQ